MPRRTKLNRRRKSRRTSKNRMKSRGTRTGRGKMMRGWIGLGGEAEKKAITDARNYLNTLSGYFDDGAIKFIKSPSYKCKICNRSDNVYYAIVDANTYKCIFNCVNCNPPPINVSKTKHTTDNDFNDKFEEI